MATKKTAKKTSTKAAKKPAPKRNGKATATPAKKAKAKTKLSAVGRGCEGLVRIEGAASGKGHRREDGGEGLLDIARRPDAARHGGRGDHPRDPGQRRNLAFQESRPWIVRGEFLNPHSEKSHDHVLRRNAGTTTLPRTSMNFSTGTQE